MKAHNQWAVGLLGLGLLSLWTGLVYAQETPTPPWNQATIDAAVSARFTQAAQTPTPDLPDLTATPEAFSQRLTADNFEQIEVLAQHEFTGDYIYVEPNPLNRDNQWVMVQSFEQKADGNYELTIALIDRTQVDQPPHVFALRGSADTTAGLRIQVIGELLYHWERGAGVNLYDFNTGEWQGEFNLPEEILFVQPWRGQNALIALTEDDIVVWDVDTQQERQRWPAHDGIFYSFILDSDIMLTYHDDNTIYAIDLETGNELQRWQSVRSNYPLPFNPVQQSVFYLTTLNRTVLKIDSNTLETLDRIEMGPGSNRVYVSPGGRYLLTWSENFEFVIRSLDPAYPTDAYEPVRGGFYDINLNEDLLLLYESSGYNLYSLSASGLEPLAFPEPIENIDENSDTLQFMHGNQLIVIHYGDRQRKATVTFWGIME